MTHKFPILFREHGSYGNPVKDCPEFVPWDLLRGAESQAQRNHSQSLSRLAERGGLSPLELYAVLRGIDFPWGGDYTKKTEYAVRYINQRLALLHTDPAGLSIASL